MTEREKQSDFLRKLLLFEENDERRTLQEQLKKAARDEKAIRRLIVFVILLGVLSLVGLGYATILLPEELLYSSRMIVRVCILLGVWSIISLATFSIYWVWCRGILNRLHEQCRRIVVQKMESNQREIPRMQTPVTSDTSFLRAS